MGSSTRTRSARLLRGLIAAVVVVVAFVAVVIGAFWAYGTSEFTQCFALFDSSESAERAAEEMEDAGFESEFRGSSPGRSVTFESGETGDDAAEFREAFGDVVEREGAKLGHPGGGCLERPPFI